MEKIKNLVIVLACSFGISFFGGVFSWEFPEGFNMLIGGIDLVCVVWLLFIVCKKQEVK